MIDALRSQMPPMDPAATQPPSAPAQLASPANAQAPATESPIESAMSVLDSEQEADQAGQSIQISLLNAGLELARTMAGQLVGTMDAPRAYAANAESAQPVSQTVDTVA